MHNLIVYHAFCWDGLIAAYNMHLIHMRDKHTCAIIPHDYKDSFKVLESTIKASGEKYDRIYLVDLSISEAERENYIHLVNWCKLEGFDVILIDHHKSTRETKEFYVNQGFTETAGTIVYNGRYSGAGLVRLLACYKRDTTIPDDETLFAVLNADKFDQDQFDEIVNNNALVRMINDSDLWRFKFPDSKPYSTFLKRCVTPEYVHNAIARLEREAIFGGPEHNERLKIGETILKLDVERFNSMKQMSFNIKLAGVDFIGIIHNSKADYSDVGQFFYEQFKKPCAIFFINGKMTKVSLRSSRELADVEPVARFYGGGGHAGAASFYQLTSVIFKMLSDAFLYNDTYGETVEKTDGQQ